MTLREKIRSSALTLGSWITIGHPAVVEIMAQAGFEWLTIDMEHTSITLEKACELIRAVQSCGMKALVRVSANEEVIIKKVMDMGADGVVVPMVKNREEAEKAVSFVRYPPRGKRGVGLFRAQKYGTGFDEYKKWVAEESVVIAQIEHIEACRNIESIISVPGIDSIIIGPYDLSGSMGCPGEYDRPEVKEALQRVQDVCIQNKFPLGFHVIDSRAEKVVERIKQGYTFIAFSLDFFFLGDRVREEMEKLRTTAKGLI